MTSTGLDFLVGLSEAIFLLPMSACFSLSICCWLGPLWVVQETRGLVAKNTLKWMDGDVIFRRQYECLNISLKITLPISMAMGRLGRVTQW